jgi:GNAT superfamily N-acetyltransferase
MTITTRRAAPVTVRPASLADAADVASCLAELGYGTPVEVVTENLVAVAASDADAVFVATESQSATVLGVASVHLLPLFHAPGSLARLTALAVRRSAQRRGVGRALLAAAEAFAWAAGCKRMEVTSGDHRPAAHALYRAVGYLDDERRLIKHRNHTPAV